MGYLTTRPLALELNHGGSPRTFSYPFILPEGSRVDLIDDLDGVTRPGFVCGDEKQIGELTGNAHDAAHRYTRVPANAIGGDTLAERKQALNLTIAEAERAAEQAREVQGESPYFQAFLVSTKSGRAYFAAGYPPVAAVGAAFARQQVERLGESVWDACAYPVSEETRAMGPGVWPLPTPMLGETS